MHHRLGEFPDCDSVSAAPERCFPGAVGALMAVEWPERLGLDLPEAWRLDLRHQDEGRLAQLTPPRNAST